jgi:hypothetical protein
MPRETITNIVSDIACASHLALTTGLLLEEETPSVDFLYCIRLGIEKQ